MAWTEKKGSGGTGNFVKWENAGTELIGVYLGPFESKDKNGKAFNNIKVRTADGREALASQTSDLADKLADVAPGTKVHIVYTGQVQTNSGRRVKKFRILVDDSASSTAPSTSGRVDPASQASEYDRLVVKLPPTIMAALKQLYKDDGARLQAMREAAKQIAVVTDDEVPF